MVLLATKLDNIDNKSKYLAIILALDHYNILKIEKDERIRKKWTKSNPDNGSPMSTTLANHCLHNNRVRGIDFAFFATSICQIINS